MREFGARGSAWAAAMDKPMLCIMTPYDSKLDTVGNGVSGMRPASGQVRYTEMAPDRFKGFCKD